jgi:hypothetical protein
MAEIVPFPAARRVAFIRKHAARMAALAPVPAEKHLMQQLTVQRDTMLRRGIAPEVVEREITTLASAIRAALWRVVLTPGGAA